MKIFLPEARLVFRDQNSLQNSGFVLVLVVRGNDFPTIEVKESFDTCRMTGPVSCMQYTGSV
jgi:hypothetical protein